MNFRVASLLFAILLPSRWLIAEESVPAPLQPYVALVAQCTQYAADLPSIRGNLREEFTSTNNPTWRADSSTERMATLELRQFEGRSVLAITAPDTRLASLAIGAPLSGDCQIEMHAYSDTDTPCDMSVFLGPVGTSPGFQFGGHNNTRNQLWTDDGNNNWHTVELPAKSLITPRHWHTVRLDRIGRELIASVDGQELGRAKLSDRFEIERPYQPMIYCYDETVLLDRFTITRPDAAAAALRAAEAWQKAFGSLTPADVDKQISELIALLDHDSSRVRDGAQGLLSQILPMAGPALRQIARTGSLEQQLRAREILQASP